MTDQRFYARQGPFSVEELSRRLDVPFQGNGALILEDVASLKQAGAKDLSFFDPKRGAQLTGTQAGACILSKDVPGMTALLTPKPYETFARAARLFYPLIEEESVSWGQAIHPTAKIAASAVLSPGVVVGPHAVIGEGCYIGPNSVVGRGVVLGPQSKIQAGVTLSHCVIGAQVQIAQGTAIGQAGFGFMMDGDSPLDFPQLGRVLVGNNIIIGANVAIDRGSLEDTEIGDGTRIDNLVQIAHGVKIGRGCIIVSQVGIAGSTTIGDRTILAGQVGVVDHVTIGKNVRVAAQSGIMRDIPDGAAMGGSPAVSIRDWHKQSLALHRLIQRKNKQEE